MNDSEKFHKLKLVKSYFSQKGVKMAEVMKKWVRKRNFVLIFFLIWIALFIKYVCISTFDTFIDKTKMV